MTLAAGLFVGSTLSSAPAQADQYDYVSALDNRGIYYASISEVIDLGKLACSRLRAGVSPQWAGDAAFSAGYASFEAAIIVVEATKNMCPDQIPVLQAYVDGEIPMAQRETPMAQKTSLA